MNSRMPVTDAIVAYLRAHPARPSDALRLWIAYCISFCTKILAPRRFMSVGHSILGSSSLMLKVDGFFAFVRPRSNDLAFITTALEPRSAQWFKVEPGSVVVDVGAHIGRYTLVAATKGSQVIAIEPDPSNFSILESNIKLNHISNVRTLCIAVSTDQCARPMYISNCGDTATSSLDRNWAIKLGAKTTHTVMVPSNTLDGLIMPMNLKTIDWLKIDVEGHEISVLEGAANVLGKTKRLLLEVAKGNEETCRNIVSKRGFKLISEEMKTGVLTNNWFLVKQPLIEQ